MMKRLFSCLLSVLLCSQALAQQSAIKPGRFVAAKSGTTSLAMPVLPMPVADIKISALPAATAATSDDLLMIVDNPGVAPVTKKITFGNLVSSLPAGSITNVMLAGAIPNNKLANPSITINGVTVALGGSASVGTVTSVAAGNGLQGGPITNTGTIDLLLNSGGGLSKTLGVGSNELGIAAGGVQTSHLAGSIPDSKLNQITTANKVADSALSSNATLLGNSTTGTSSIVRANSPTLVTPVLGVAQGTSFAITGTAGSGFQEFLAQSSNPSAPASGYREFADSLGRRSWIRASDGFTRTWDATLTANRVYTLPDLSLILAGIDVAQTWTGVPTFTNGITLGTSGNLFGGTNLIEQRNGANAQEFRLYRTFVDSANYSRYYVRQTSSDIKLGVEKLGSPSGSQFILDNSSGGGIILSTNGNNNWQISASGHLLPTDNTYTAGDSTHRILGGYFGSTGIIQGGALNLGSTSTDGVVLQNTTAAAAGAQQYSPSLHFNGRGWATNSGGSSQSVDYRMTMISTQGSANPDGYLSITRSVNGGSYITVLNLSPGDPAANIGGDLSNLRSVNVQACGGASRGLFGSNGVDFTVDCQGLKLRSSGSIMWSINGDGTNSTGTWLRRAADANIALGAADVDTTPVAQTISVQNALAGGTSNVAGANFTINGSQGKGTGAGGSLIFQVAPAGSTGTSVNALATALTIDSTKKATFASDVVSNTGYTSASGSTGGLYFGASQSSNYIAPSSLNNIQVAAGTTLSFLINGFTKARFSSTAGMALGAADAASPVAQTFSVQSVVAGTSDTAGVDWTRKASASTGNAIGGAHIWQVTPAGTSGTSQNTFVEAFRVNGYGGVRLQSVTFANLPASSTNGDMLYCSDCVINATCAGSGSGAMAKRIAGGWVCN